MRNTAFVFSGQGSQYAGMGNDVIGIHPQAKAYFEEAGEILGMNLLEICRNGDEAALADTAVSQPAILIVSYLRYLAYCLAHQTEPLFYAGHSLGEYTALLAAGVLEFREAVRLIGVRAACMKRCAAKHGGTMAAVVCNRDYTEILPVIRQFRADSDGAAVIGCLNSSRQIVLSGSIAQIKRLTEALRQTDGVRVIPLDVSGAFHSPLMAEAAEAFSDALLHAEFHALPRRAGVISNVTGVPYTDIAQIRKELYLQITHPVHWCSSVHYMALHGADTFIEFGAKPTLSQLIKKEVSANAVPYI